MHRLLFALLLTLFCVFSLAAQTIISEELDFSTTDPEAHAIYTNNGNYFIGRTLYIHNDTIGFQIRKLSEVTVFLFEEVRFLGTVEETIQSSTNITLADAGINERRLQPVQRIPIATNPLL